MSSSFFSLRAVSAVLCALMLFGCATMWVSAEVGSDGSDMRFDCESAVLMDLATGTVLYSYNADKALPPASVTKIMTLLLVMEEIERGTLKYTDTVTASAYAASMGGSQIYLKEGEQMSVEDMIKSVVIASANDAAVALAEHICGSEEVFVARMNERARELGMKNTNFENTNGLDDTAKDHLTSAMDIAIMSRALVAHEDILKYSSTWMDTIRDGSFGLTNTNRLVRFYQGITGLKTGSTAKAKFCVSATAKRGNMHLVCVVMGAPSSNVRNSIATKLLNWGFSTYSLYEDAAEDMKPVRVAGGEERECAIRSGGFSCVLKKGAEGSVEKRYIVDATVCAPISRGDAVGRIEYYSDGKKIGECAVYSCVDVDKIDYLGLFVRILSKFSIK